MKSGASPSYGPYLSRRPGHGAAITSVLASARATATSMNTSQQFARPEAKVEMLKAKR